VPAFSNCSLDNNPGNGDPADGDYYGQINGYLAWENDVVDEPDRWEMTVLLSANCPWDHCTVDLTPRHCRRFRPKPGQQFAWTNTSLADGRQLQSGTVTADQWGLVTIGDLIVSKGKNRITIERK
jgi:hypothetical protein